MSELRYALRVLFRTPVVSVLAIVSLALGIGANVTIFTIANAFLDQRIAGAGNVDRLVRIYRGSHSPLQYSELERVRRERAVFTEVAGERLTNVAANISGNAEPLHASLVTDGYFTMLAVKPELGRMFAASDSADATPVVVISDNLWKNRFSGDSSIVGRALRVNDHAFTIIGVAPPEFSSSMFLWRADIWLPPSAAPLLLGMPFSQWGGSLYATARLAPGIDMNRAKAAVATVAARIAAEDPRGHDRFFFTIDNARGLAAELRGPAVIASAFLMIVVGMVLLIACANVANLLLARAAGRRRELGVRTALGAGRWRLVRQLLVESILLALTGGLLGILLATWAADLLKTFVMSRTPEPLSVNVAPDGHVLAFALLVSVVSALLFGLMPALRATSADIITALREEAPQSTGRSRARGVLIAVQVALCTVLLACSTLFLRSLVNARVIDPGFDATGVMDVSVNLSSRNLNDERGLAFFDQLQARAAALPSVRSATLAAIVPLGGTNMQVGLWVEGRKAEGPHAPFAPSFNVVGPSYFQTLGIPIVVGRAILAEDRPTAPGVVVINERMARHLWPGETAIGKRVSFEGANGPWVTVVGIARTTKYTSLGESAVDFLYMPFAQHYRSEMVLQLRTAGANSLTAATLRDLVHEMDPQLPPVTVNTLADDMRIVLLPAQISAGLLGAFGLLALLLASVGIYGVTSYTVAQRTREMGIRSALGATARDLVELLARQSMRVVAIGAGIGLLLAFGAARLLTSQLYGVSATDPVTFVAMPLFLLAVAFAATLVPARRATQIDPAEALRVE
jgi:predicted permease